jgi:hypothetical protein
LFNTDFALRAVASRSGRKLRTTQLASDVAARFVAQTKIRA